MIFSVVGMVLAPRECGDGRPSARHTHLAAPAPGGGVRSRCRRITPGEVRRAWRLVGPLDDVATCPRCQQTGKTCARCGRPITRRQSHMSRPDGRWLHILPCAPGAGDAHDDL